jgi:hypothetical protein
VGRHAAADGASAHPLVAAALARRAGDDTRRRADQQGERNNAGGLGWPGPPSPGGGGLGWPDDTAEADSAAVKTASAVSPRRGWRRILGVLAA